jgi:hypothetical protein
MECETYSEMFGYHLLKNCACPPRSVTKNIGRFREGQEVMFTLQSCPVVQELPDGWKICFPDGVEHF